MQRKEAARTRRARLFLKMASPLWPGTGWVMGCETAVNEPARGALRPADKRKFLTFGNRTRKNRGEFESAKPFQHSGCHSLK
jgi:hypothetical protein